MCSPREHQKQIQGRSKSARLQCARSFAHSCSSRRPASCTLSTCDHPQINLAAAPDSIRFCLIGTSSGSWLGPASLMARSHPADNSSVVSDKERAIPMLDIDHQPDVEHEDEQEYSDDFYQSLGPDDRPLA
eukprot:3066440-Amphidinium_carterae.1